MKDEGYSGITEKKLKAIRRPPMDAMTKTAADLLTYDKIEKIITRCQTSRDRAMLVTLYEGGLRIGELAALEWGDLKFDELKRMFLQNPDIFSDMLKEYQAGTDHKKIQES